MIIPKPKKLSSADASLILDVVCDFYHQPRTAIVGSSRRANVMEPRHAAMYLMKQHASMTLELIGVAFNGRDHTTVLHGIRTVKRALDVDQEFQRRMFYLEKSMEEHIKRRAVISKEEEEWEIENLQGVA